MASTLSPDLSFAIDLCVSRNDTVTCRIRYDCTPAHEFAGITPTGRRVPFAEHVFYHFRFREGRIEQMWSLIDTNAIREQLS